MAAQALRVSGVPCVPSICATCAMRSAAQSRALASVCAATVVANVCILRIKIKMSLNVE